MNTRAKKPLSEMPDSVRDSAWTNQKWSTWACSVCWMEDKLCMTFVYLTMLSWWTVGYWALVWLVPFEPLARGVPTVRMFIAVTYAATFVLMLLTHWIGIKVVVPRADRSYPVLRDALVTFVFKRLSLSMVACAAAMFALVASGQTEVTASLEHLLFAAAILIVGGISGWFYYHPPTYGYVVPSEGEVAADAASRAAAFQRQMQPVHPSEGKAAEDYVTPIQVRKAKISFQALDGMAAVKEKLLEPAKKIVAERPAGVEDPGNGVLLHGLPGNGKTAFAEALAGELNVPFLPMTYGDVSSKWVGEMPRLIANCFALAKRSAPCVFFIDEIDSFVVSREQGSNNSEDQKVTNTLLTEMVELRKHRVVLVGATNFLAKLDGAAIREGRFDYKVEITPPDELARIGLLRKGLTKYSPTLAFEEPDLVAVAKRWNGFSVSRIQAVVKAVPRLVTDKGINHFTYSHWMLALREVQGRAGRVPPNSKSLSELVLDAQTREALEMVAARLKDVSRIESMGGTLPSGVLFQGPPGTGKTAAARALAKECGWAFLSVAGPDLVADRDKLGKIYAEAADLRPAIVFVDEADDLLRSRQFSATPDLTNRLLVLMDGVEERVKDVIFIAATNHPEDIDPALLRAGRFTEKVSFAAPGSEAIPRYVGDWLKNKKVTLEPSIDVFDVAAIVDGRTIADIDGALQYALNRAIHRHEEGSPLVLAGDDLRAAVIVVLAER